MIRFKEWLKQQEMVGTGAVYDGTKSPDFNWWGDPESAHKPPKYAKDGKDLKYTTSQKIQSSKKSKKR